MSAKADTTPQAKARADEAETALTLVEALPFMRRYARQFRSFPAG